jgi:hypothetical protein
MTVHPSLESASDLNPSSTAGSTPDSGSTTDALSQFQAEFGAHMVRKNINFNAILNDQGEKLGSVIPGITTQNKFAAEGQLLGSIPSHIGAGIVDSAKETWQHLGRASFETVTGLVLGAGFCLLSKNPDPMLKLATTWAGRAFLGIAALDLGSRFARPMADVWSHPEQLNQDKKILGDNIGDAVFNYSLAIGGGIAGANLGEKYLATTKLGTILQGFKETEVSAEALGKLVSDPTAGDHPLSNMARAFSRRAVGLDASASTSASASSSSASDITGAADASSRSAATGDQLAIKGNMRLRHMPDGSQIGSTGDGSVMVLTKDGTALWFKNNRSLFGFRNKLDLAKVLHQGGDETDVLTGMYSPTTTAAYGKGSGAGQAGRSGAQIIGKDPSLYFDTPTDPNAAEGSSDQVLGGRSGTSYTTVDGTKFTTGKSGNILAVEAGGNRVFLDAKGSWKLGLADVTAKPIDFAGLNLDPASFNLAAIQDRFETAKKGAEVGLTEIMLERAGDIGSSVFEHEVLVHGTKAAEVESIPHFVPASGPASGPAPFSASGPVDAPSHTP